MNEPSKICERQPLKNLKGYGTFNFFVSIYSARSTDKDYSQNMAQTGYKASRIPILTHFWVTKQLMKQLFELQWI